MQLTDQRLAAWEYTDSARESKMEILAYTWVNEFGEHKQTNEINYNPNGILKGNWTLQVNVRN